MTKFIQDVTIGANLQNLRKKSGYTQEQICAQMSIHGRPMARSTYAQIETGARNIFISDLLVLKDILHATYDDIFRDLVPINKYEQQ